MRSPLRIPRLLLPRDHFETWSIVACDRHASDENYWEDLEKKVGQKPSALGMILPDVYSDDERKERIEAIHENMYCALETRYLTKLERGCVLVERTTKSGTRRGILALVDLEEYSYEFNKTALMRAVQDIDPSKIAPRVEARKGSILEFSRAMAFYKDKRNKVLHLIEDEDIEKIYDFDLMAGGGHIMGYFIPEYASIPVVQALAQRADPCFFVADDAIATAKAYWDEIKGGIPEEEQKNHPARFTLVEFVNIYDEAINLVPVHRLVKEVEKDVFTDYFTKQIKCRVDGCLIYPQLSGADGIAFIDQVISIYIKANGGKVDYVFEERLKKEAAEEDNVGVVIPAIGEDEIFSALKTGKRFPQNAFSAGEEYEKRYYLEGREISYD